VSAILERYHLHPGEVLVLDDLKPGVDMARAAGVAVAAAGWAYTIERIRRYMIEACDFYFETVASFRDHVFANTGS
jgi:phosphoglycolate phosphatase/pyrophosphatase PpaX